MFLAAWDNRKKLWPWQVKGWLATVARNRAFNRLRDRREELPLEEDALLLSPDSPHVEAEQEARLFEPFSHGRTAGTREGLVGLGLAITRDIVEAHGGVIRYARNPGGGAIFTVLLPLAK